MTPQSSFMVAAPLNAGSVAELRGLLATMNATPGSADPFNALVPFGEFSNLHFARFLILEDQTLSDLATAYGVERPAPPVYLAFLGDLDGPYEPFIRDLSARAGTGLRRIFSYCEGFEANTDLAQWMIANEHRSPASYINWVGRTVLQCREEEALRLALRKHLSDTPTLASLPMLEVQRELRAFAQQHVSLTPAETTPVLWALRHVIDIALLVAIAILGVVTLPLTVIPFLLLARKLRALETADREIIPRPDPMWAAKLASIEDYGVSNQFSAMGSLKPGVLRKWLLKAVLFLVNLTTGIIYTKGRLARVSSIHFARWVYLDGGTRLLFCSNYDGNLDSYMDDFINKVAFGLNAVFSNGVGYPKTRWLILDGAKNEQAFKYFIRRHELATEVWYNAHSGLTSYDLARNSRIRKGVEAMNPTESEIAQWLPLL